MRFAIITISFVLLNVAAAAAERETFTLTDGRTLVGFYDESAGALTLDDGKSKSRVTVKLGAELIKARKPAPAPAIATHEAKPVEVSPAPPAPAKAAPGSSLKSTLLLVDSYRAEMHAKENDAYHSWIESADLRPIKEPVLGKDPRQSEIKELEQVRLANKMVNDLTQSFAYGEIDRMVTLMQSADQDGTWANYVALAATYGKQ